jgi:hypothetical protein
MRSLPADLDILMDVAGVRSLLLSFLFEIDKTASPAPSIQFRSIDDITRDCLVHKPNANSGAKL